MVPSPPLEDSKPSAKKNYKSKQVCRFRPEHELAYGMKPNEIDSVTGEVISAQCLFCAMFGRERAGGGTEAAAAAAEKEESDDEAEIMEETADGGTPSRKRKLRALTTNVRYFKSPFRTDKYTQHLTRQHASKWGIYKHLGSEERQTFFEGIVLAAPKSIVPSARGKLHPNLVISPSPAHNILFTMMRDVNTTSADFVKYSKRSMRLIAEDALAEFPTTPVDIETPCGPFSGVRSLPPTQICAVSVIRSGDALLEAVREVEPACKVGKILIQRNESTMNKQAMLFYSKLPADIADLHVLLCDPMLATGGSAMLALKVLCQDYNVDPSKIVFANMICAPDGLRSIARSYPQIKIVTASVEEKLNDDKYIVPGLGDFGDRYFNTL